MNGAREIENVCFFLYGTFGIFHGITRENCGHLKMVVPV